MKIFLEQKGQALIEYLLAIVFISVIGVNLVQTARNSLKDMAGGLTVALTRQLSVGVCKELCYSDAFVNFPNIEN